MSNYDLNPDFFLGEHHMLNQNLWEASIQKPDVLNSAPYASQYLSDGMDQSAFGGNGDYYSGGFPCQLVAQSSSGGTDPSTGYSVVSSPLMDFAKQEAGSEVAKSPASRTKGKPKPKRIKLQERDARQSSMTSLTTSSSASSSQSPSSAGVAAESNPSATPESSIHDARSVSLERNRVAAAKCRMRKKEWVDTLQIAAREGNLQSRELQGLVRALEQEVAVLKDMLQNCSCHFHT